MSFFSIIVICATILGICLGVIAFLTERRQNKQHDAMIRELLDIPNNVTSQPELLIEPKTYSNKGKVLPFRGSK